MHLSAHPIMSIAEAEAFRQAVPYGYVEPSYIEEGIALSHAILTDFNTLRPFPRDPRILILIGNDLRGLILLQAGRSLLEARPRGTLHIVQICIANESFLLAQTMLTELKALPSVTCTLIRLDTASVPVLLDILTQNLYPFTQYAICLEGLSETILKHPEYTYELDTCIETLNQNLNLTFKASSGSPAGLDIKNLEIIQQTIFKADYTYVTGIPSAELFSDLYLEYTGRLRYLDIDCFRSCASEYIQTYPKLLTSAVLNSLRCLRSTQSYKYTFGHICIIGGSRAFPGALLMAASAALHSGVGIVTICGPENLFPHYFSTIPEAIHNPLLVNTEGNIHLKSLAHLQSTLARASAVLIGNGLTLDAEVQTLICTLVSTVCLPIVLDADALTLEVLEALQQRPKDWPSVALTPHKGEWLRLNPHSNTPPTIPILKDFCKQWNVTTMLKGPITHIVNSDTACLSTYGGPVLARAGSGDLLAGLAAGLIAQHPRVPLIETLSQAVVWHGKAADRLAINKGEVAVTATRLLPYLSEVLREQSI